MFLYLEDPALFSSYSDVSDLLFGWIKDIVLFSEILSICTLTELGSFASCSDPVMTFKLYYSASNRFSRYVRGIYLALNCTITSSMTGYSRYLCTSKAFQFTDKKTNRNTKFEF